MIPTVRVIDEEIVDQDRHLHQYLHHLHQQQHHPHDQMIQIDEKVQQIHVIVIQDENMIVNDDDDNDIISEIIIIIIDDQDPDQEDGKFKFKLFSSKQKKKEIIRDHFNLYFIKKDLFKINLLLPT